MRLAGASSDITRVQLPAESHRSRTTWMIGAGLEHGADLAISFNAPARPDGDGRGHDRGAPKAW